MYIWKSYVKNIKKFVFHSCKNKVVFHVWNWMSFIYSIDFLEPNSDFQMPLIFLLVDKNTKCGYPFS